MSDLPNLKVCVVGSGNAAHVLAALLPSKSIHTTWLASFENSAAKINISLKQHKAIEATFAAHNTPSGLVKATPEFVTANAKRVIPDADIIVLPLPSFAYPSVLMELKKYLKKGAHIIVTPGQGGFDWMAREVLGEQVNDLILTALMPMPFNCRIEEFGHKVSVQEFKRRYKIAVYPEKKSNWAQQHCERLFGSTEICGSFLNAMLYPINAIIHPARLFSLCHAWSPDNPMPHNPLFYEDMTHEDVALIDSVNTELLNISNGLSKAGVRGLNVPHIKEFLCQYVYDDESDLLTFFKSNPAYQGFRCPFKQESAGWSPDFENRYFTEDIPLGLCIYKGLADLVDVDTPHMNKIIKWAQTHMGKEYIINNKLIGKDVAQTNAPQRFNLNLQNLTSLSG